MEIGKGVAMFLDEVLPRIDSYRAKNLNKYHREKELEFSEYTKMERYKNRVRIIDIFLPALRKLYKNLTNRPTPPHPEGLVRGEGGILNREPKAETEIE